MTIPLTKPNPPRLSEAVASLREIEDSGLFSNFGPVNTRFEAEILSRLFGGEGACLTVCNATIGLMLAVKAATQGQAPGRRYALMPSFTFAAAAQAAMWCGLTPLFCDIDPDDWTADARAEDALLRRHKGKIAVVMPYATFGYDMDLQRYEALSRAHDMPVVVDAAASLGTISHNGKGYGTGFSGTVVYSMHATKSFATGEGGIVYSGDKEVIRELRMMCNFGFGRPRNATMPGLNGKLSEVGALLALLRLADYEVVMQKRAELVSMYRNALPELTFQKAGPNRQAHQFVSALLPRELAAGREAFQAGLKARGIGMASYFSPHVAEQDYFRDRGLAGPLPVTESVAARIVSLPLFDVMTRSDLQEVVTAVRAELAAQLPAASRDIAYSGRQAPRRPRRTLVPDHVELATETLPAEPLPSLLPLAAQALPR